MLEDYEESISLTLRTRSSKKPSGIQEKMETPMAPMALQDMQENKEIGSVARLMISSQNLRVPWNPVNPPECVWKNLHQIIMRTILQEEVTIQYNITIWFYNITIWFTNLFLCRKRWKFPQQKQQWIKNGRNLQRLWRGTWQKSETNQRWSMKQGRRAEMFILPHWSTSVIWRMSNWRQSTKNTKVELYSETIL